MAKDDGERELPDSWFKTDINGDQWTVYLADDDDHTIADEGHAAVTDHEQKEIICRRAEISLKVIKHEIWHAYFGYCYLDDTNIDVTNTEEVSAGLYADRDETMRAKALEIYNRLLKLRDDAA